MKGVVLVPSVRGPDWLAEVLPGLGPAELPLAGRRWIDYAVEWAEQAGYGMVEVLDWRFSEAVAADFADLTAHPIPVFYQRGEGELPGAVADLARQSSPLAPGAAAGDAEVDVVWGLELAGFRIDSVAAWHRASLDLLAGTGFGGRRFTLPGYSAEAGVHLGRNVVTEPGFEAKKPVLVQDDAWCARNVRLDGSCIVGRGSFVGEGTRLERTVVADRTYVGTDLELVDKIVVGHRVIDAATGAWVDIGERGIARALGGWTWPRWALAAADFLRGRANRGRRP